MQRELIVKSIGLGTSSDLTLLAPLRQGFVPSLDSVTYKTRVKKVLGVLHGLRQASHEYATARLLSDAVERVGVIQSVRVAVMEPEQGVLLAVSFDGPWQAYIRVLWDKVGALLDLIFCNTEGYKLSSASTFEEWFGWARSVQRETGFFYGPPASSALDLRYDRRLLRMREARLSEDTSVDELRAVVRTAEDDVNLLVLSKPDEFRPDDPQLDLPPMFRRAAEQVRQSLQALAALYRLTDLYLPVLAGGDGDVLRRAAIELLVEFIADYSGPLHDDIDQQRERFDRALEWLCPNDTPPPPPSRSLPELPPQHSLGDDIRADVQGGILHQYDPATHGALLLFSFDSYAAAAGFLDKVLPTVTRDSDDPEVRPGGIFVNIAFTPSGLRACGVDEDAMGRFPEEFLQGMAARAGMLGDVRHNHPRRWRLPRRFIGVGQAPAAQTVELTGVHAVVQLRCQATDAAQLASDDLTQPGSHPLAERVQALEAMQPGARLLAVQSMRRRFANRGEQSVSVDHFGFADGNGQPDIEWPSGHHNRANRVLLGEVLWGHPSRADDAPAQDDERRPWMANGSFLVLRKYRQFPERLDAAVRRTADDMSRRFGDAQDHTETVYAKLVGRHRDGTPLAPVAQGDINAFNYADDVQGSGCPLHAHIRRANPREQPLGSARPPRIVRRGMSYGPAAGGVGDVDAHASAGMSAGMSAGQAAGIAAENTAAAATAMAAELAAATEEDPNEDQERASDQGLMFMAYNQDIGEQFEVVQRWLVGGNSTGSSSAVSCPIVGVPENGIARHFAFEATGSTGPAGTALAFDVRLEAQAELFDDPAVVTQLQWGAYLFAPSMSALARLGQRAQDASSAQAAASVPVPVPWEATAELQDARRRIERLLALGHGDAGLQGWKEALEDPEEVDRQRSASLWSAIRRFHGGALDTPYGVLVAERELALRVLRHDHLYSVCGQRQRMLSSFGDIYLGLDDGPDYRTQSTAMNHEIGLLDFNDTFEYSRDAAARKIAAIVDLAERSAKTGERRFDALFEAREVLDDVLAELSEQWFGLQDRPDERRLVRGSVDWSWQPGDASIYPGHFTALSRNMFQPNPGTVPVDLANRYGQGLRANMEAFVSYHLARPSVPNAPGKTTPAPLAKAAFQLKDMGADFVGRLITGVLMGFTPTIIGAVLNVLLEWRRDDRFAQLRAALDGRDDAATAQTVLGSAMHGAMAMRPMPQITWRTSMHDHHFDKSDGSSIPVALGRKVALGLVAGTQQSLATGETDGRLMFGGTRQPGCPGQRRGPTHACPGHRAGEAAMLGSLVAFLTCRLDLREGPQPLTYSISGRLAEALSTDAAAARPLTPT